jgi:CheY-like chemotaxis protein
MCKLVMIDDNPLEHLIMQKMLDTYDLFPGTAHSADGKVIMEFLEENCTNIKHLPDVIFLDLNMPAFSGWDFMSSFAKIYPRLKKPIAIYVLSSSIDPEDINKTKKYPFVKDFIIKPIEKQTLIDLYSIYNHASRIAS